MSNSKKDTSRTGSLLTAALGESHHCLLSDCCPLRYEKTRGVAIIDVDELLEPSSIGIGCLMSMKRLRGFPLAVDCLSGGVSMCMASCTHQCVLDIAVRHLFNDLHQQDTTWWILEEQLRGN